MRAVRSLFALPLLAVLAGGCATAGPEGGPETPDDPARVEAPTDLDEPIASADPPRTLPPAPEPQAAGPDPDAAPVAESGPAEARQLLDDSLESFEVADELWTAGEFDGALAALDYSYHLMHEADPGEDDVLARQKDDLRRLLARRIGEVYASRATGAGEVRSSIPFEVNRYVEAELERFRGPEREAFLAAVERSGLYRPYILDRLREAGMPEELSWLPVVESWFKTRALSTARALGMWQFISSTGTRYGLRRTAWVDERMDPEKSTVAALAYLRDLHGMFGDWLTALAAYNSGETRIRRILERQEVAHFDRFWDIYEQLPRETRRYVPRFVATVLVVRDPEAHGFDDLPAPRTPPATETVVIRKSVRLETLDERLELPKGTLADLNPELRHRASPDDAFDLRVPAGLGARVTTVAASLPAADLSRIETHRVRRGETLSTIAARYGTSVGSLMRLNGLRDPHRIALGQRLKIEVASGGGAVATSVPTSAPTVYTVRRGDSLWTIARRYGLTVDGIRRANGLSSDRLRPGQTLRLRPEGGATYRVRPGDTLGRIAERHRVGLSELLAANGLRRSSTIHPGQQLVIPR